MQYSHLRRLIGAVALATLGACDRPTAPQARDIIEQTQKTVFSNPAQFDSRLGLLLTRAQGPTTGFGDRLPADVIVVERNGERAQYLAIVLERVYVPPGGSGGLPYIRRSLVAWDKENKRGFAIAAEDPIAAVAPPRTQLLDDDQPARIWGRKGFVVQSERGGRDLSFGVDGRIEFSTGMATGACAFTRDDIAMSGGDGEGGWESAPARCESARYNVSVDARMQRGDPNNSDILAAFTPNARIRIDAQSVRGVRIVTNCGTKPVGRFMRPEMGCWSFMAYWRDNGQFAPQLGVDVSRIGFGSNEYTPGVSAGGSYWQPLDAGSGAAFQCCYQYFGPVRYVVSRPDGTVLRRGEAAVAANDSVAKYLGGFNLQVRPGSRSLIFMQGGSIFDPQGSSYYSAVVVELTVLPDPGVARPKAYRNQT